MKKYKNKSKKKRNLLERLDTGPVICAEGFLFEIEKRGYMASGEFVPMVSLEHPEALENLHRDFQHAGSDIVQAFTYNGHREKMRVIGKEKLLEPLNRSALRIAKKVANRVKLVGVTILTSLDNKSVKEIGFDKNIKELVLHQAKLASKAKLDAVVCSPKEVKLIKKVFKKEIITPGIRMNKKKNNDQKRILTPKQAYQNGSDWLVMGRPITRGNITINIKRLIDHLNQWLKV